MLMMPRSMAWADGILYQAAWSAILAAPAEGGVLQTLVADVHPEGIWVEGDQVLYSVLNQLVQVPRNGGSPTVILDGGSTPDPSAASGQTLLVADQRILDAGYFYWTSIPHNAAGTFVSRIPRMGGTVEVIAELPILGVGGMALVSDGVLAAGFDGNGNSAVVAPFGGGPLRLLASSMRYGSLLSVENAGTIWSIRNIDGTYVLMLSPSDGSPTSPLSPALPNNISWDWVYPDGNGGHFLSAWEAFEDGGFHRSVFLLSADGSTTRLACDPSQNISGFRGTALSPDALYVAVGGGAGWSIVKVPRTVQHP
jgi:hypothetical protein